MVEQEEWRDVVDWEGLYQVSNLGRVKSLISTPWRRDGIKQPYLQNGYFRVYLGSNGNGACRSDYVHRLVARAFLGEPPEGKPQVNHIDGNRADSRLCNLEWCSAAYNVQDGRRREYLSIVSGQRGDGLKIFDKWEQR